MMDFMADFGRKAPQKSSGAGAPSGAGGCVISALDVAEDDGEDEHSKELMRALGLDDVLATAVPAASGSHEAEDADAALVEVLIFYYYYYILLFIIIIIIIIHLRCCSHCPKKTCPCSRT